MLSEENSSNQFEPAKLDHSDAGAMDRGSPDHAPNAPPPQTGQRISFKMPPVFTQQMDQFMPPARVQRMNIAFAKSKEGLMKVGEMLLLFVLYCCCINATPGAVETWCSHLTWTGMIIIFGLYTLQVIFPHLVVDNEATKEGLAFLELLFYAVGTLFSFVSALMFVYNVAKYTTAASVLSLLLTILTTIIFAFETFLKVRLWKHETTTADGVHNTAAQLP